MVDDILIQDIVNIFNTEGVELVRLSGLVKREKIDANTLHLIIYKLNQGEAIKYHTCCYCPHCREIFYLLKEETEHKCDTCGLMFSVNFLNIINEKYINNIISI